MGIFSRKKGRPPRHLASLTAAGQTYNAAEYTDFTSISLQRQDWQRRAFDIYDAEGHLFYATNYIGGAMSRIQLVGATKPKNHGELEQPTILKSGPVADAIAGIESPLGGQSGFLRQIGRNIFLTGEAWVIASTETYQDGSVETNWDAVSISELVNDGTAPKRRRLPGGQPEALPKSAVTFRIWKEHPRYSELADAGTRSCLELLEKIIILNRAEKAIARSQLAGAGILALPQELVPPAWQNQGNTPNPMESNPLWQSLAETMLAPLNDENSPAAVVPWLLVGPGDVIGKIKYEPMKREFDSAGAQASIKNAIEQIANTLELPKEIILGVGEATHWTAWSIREDVFQAHIQPLIELVCAGLTRTFLKQALAKFSDAELKANGIDDRDDIIVWYDPSQLIIQPDKGDKMLGLHDRFVVTDDALARELGVPEADRLDHDSDEYKMRVGVKLADPGMAITGKPTPPAPPATGAGGGGAGPKGYSPSRGKSPQGPRAAPAKLPSERRARAGLPQDSRTNTLTSAAHSPDATAFGDFDLYTLNLFRTMAERHVRKAVSKLGASVVAAATPGDLIEEAFIAEFTEAAYFTWSDGAGLVSALFGDLPNPMFQSAIDVAVKDSTNYYRQLLTNILDKKAFSALREPIYGEFITSKEGKNTMSLVQPGDIRPLLVTLGGGTTDVTVPLMGGITSGNTMREWLRLNGIDTDQKIWLYGQEELRRTFNGHLQMDGLVFTDWDDPALKIAPQDAWLRRTHYVPGDHWGCACVVAPYIPNFDAPYQLDTPTV